MNSVRPSSLRAGAVRGWVHCSDTWPALLERAVG